MSQISYSRIIERERKSLVKYHGIGETERALWQSPSCTFVESGEGHLSTHTLGMVHKLRKIHTWGILWKFAGVGTVSPCSVVKKTPTYRRDGLIVAGVLRFLNVEIEGIIIETIAPETISTQVFNTPSCLPNLREINIRSIKAKLREELAYSDHMALHAIVYKLWSYMINATAEYRNLDPCDKGFYDLRLYTDDMLSRTLFQYIWDIASKAECMQRGIDYIRGLWKRNAIGSHQWDADSSLMPLMSRQSYTSRDKRVRIQSSWTWTHCRTYV